MIGQLERRYALKSETAAPLREFYGAYHRIRTGMIGHVSKGTPLQRVRAIEATSMRDAVEEVAGGRLDHVMRNGYQIDFSRLNGSPDDCERIILGNAIEQYAKQGGEQAAYQLLKAIHEGASRAIDSLPREVAREVRGEQKKEESSFLEGIIGNEEMKRALQRDHHRLLNYDLTRKVNPFTVVGRGAPRTVLIAGPPGTGKTTIVKGYMKRASSISEEYGLAPVYEHYVDNSSKTKYQNDGLQGLVKIIGATRRPGIHLTLIDDADMVFFSRGERQSDDEGRLLHQAMQWLEEEDRGNEQIYLISNRVSSFEEALFSRAAQRIIHALGPQTSSERGAALEYKLRMLKNDHLLDVQEWEKAGDFLVGLSGRDIKNISKRVIEYSESDGMFDMKNYWHHEDEIREVSRKKGKRINLEDIGRIVRGYSLFKERERENVRDEMIAQGVEQRMLTFMIEREVQRRLAA